MCSAHKLVTDHVYFVVICHFLRNFLTGYMQWWKRSKLNGTLFSHFWLQCTLVNCTCFWITVFKKLLHLFYITLNTSLVVWSDAVIFHFYNGACGNVAHLGFPAVDSLCCYASNLFYLLCRWLKMHLMLPALTHLTNTAVITVFTEVCYWSQTHHITVILWTFKAVTYASLLYVYKLHIQTA